MLRQNQEMQNLLFFSDWSLVVVCLPNEHIVRPLVRTCVCVCVFVMSLMAKSSW